MVWQEASPLLLSFRSKFLDFKKKVVTCFTKSGLSHVAVTHTTQNNFQEMEEESNHFIEFMKVKVVMNKPYDIINVDQTPIPYSFHSSKMLDTKGSKMIHVHALTAVTKLVTLAVTFDPSGKMLLPMLIFKGALNGCITKCKFVMCPDRGHYSCQKKLWMDSDMMNRWIDLVLVPWKNLMAPGIVPTLILDAYRVHVMGTIVN
jgi:hypothetical protein